ncbi:LOW QUALITY PROTEIN: hypothetical protein N665_0158s0071 [Sinapis alba]|nr:LOW QUALITY PROTEIN: hypothetical protein N665_0158s0071 [Sinapis alba]
MDSSSSPFQGANNEEEEFHIPEYDQRSKRKQSSGNSHEQSKTTRVLATRSNVWSHFKRIEENRDKCVCNYCQKIYSCPTKSGTTNLRNHLNCCNKFRTWQDGQDSTKRQQNISKECSLKTAKILEDVFREATNEMFVIGHLPLSFVESVAFKHFCNKTNLSDHHSRCTTIRKIVEMYVKRKVALKKLFRANKQRISITIDIWVSQVTNAYWRLKKLIIGFKYVVDHKVMKGEFLHMCWSIINLIVKDGLSDVDDSVTTIRNAISYVRFGTNRQREFKLKVDFDRTKRGSLPLDVSTRIKELNDYVLSILTDLFKEYSEINGKQAEANVQASQFLQSQELPTIDLLDDGLSYHRIEKMYNTMLKEIGVRDINELEAYLKADVENPDVMLGTDYDVLSWWKVNSGTYSILSHIARDLFVMQVSPVASEIAFSKWGG